MPDPAYRPQRNPSWSQNLVRVLLVCAGCVAILLPAWLPNNTSAPIERGTVKLLQAFLLAAATTIMLGAAPHAGHYRPVCRILALILISAVVGEIGDFLSGILGWKIPEIWIIGLILSVALFQTIRHRRAMLHFLAILGNHAASGMVASALLILYVFNRVIGTSPFWKAALGKAYSSEIPRICKSYLELLACYFIFIGALGLSLTLARRKDPS